MAMHWSKSYLEKEDGESSKISIKFVPSKTRLDNQIAYENQIFETVCTAIKSVFSNKTIPQGYEELYKMCEVLCLRGKAVNVYNQISFEIGEFATLELKRMSKQRQGQGLEFLEIINSFWTNYRIKLNTIRCIFVYLDRCYVLHTNELASIWDLGLEKLRVELGKDTKLCYQLTEELLFGISKERDGEKQLISTIKPLVGMLIDLNMYKPSFEALLLKNTKNYYEKESNFAIKKIRALLMGNSERQSVGMDSKIVSDVIDIPTYFRHAEIRIIEENNRVSEYLDSSTRSEILKIVQTELLTKQTHLLLRLGFATMVDKGMIEDLKKVYILFQLIGETNTLKSHFFSYCKKQGAAYMQNQINEKEIVPELISFKKKLDFILTNCFSDNEQFNYTLTEAFETIIDGQQTKSAKLISRFLDDKLRAKNISGSQLEESFDDALKLFRFLGSKHSFEIFYKRDMARRLILGKSSLNDSERLLLLKLKIECGSGFTNKLEAMLRDMSLSSELMEKFKQTEEGRSIAEDNFDFDVNVLTLNVWPSFPRSTLVLPKRVQDAQNKFDAFYKELYKSKKLQWEVKGDTSFGISESGSIASGSVTCPVSGYAIVSTDFGQDNGGTKEFMVTHGQAAVLSLFMKNEITSNSKQKDFENALEDSYLSYEFIQNQTSMDDEELKTVMLSLCFGKVKVLKKRSDQADRQILDSDVFCVNENCINEIPNPAARTLPRYKINQINSSFMGQKQRIKGLESVGDSNLGGLNRRSKSTQKRTKHDMDSESPVTSKSQKISDLSEKDFDGKMETDNEKTGRESSKSINEGSSDTDDDEQVIGRKPDAMSRLVESKVHLDHMYQVDAAVVRLLKYHRNMTHTQLIEDLGQILKFPLKVSDLKKRIESLIDRDYIERSGANSDEYNYIA
ncbi:hypothetical protein BB558_001824 [Smittium angustum]|uniref:Cullin family profile domain-containing protein n=1 Tax=Smittium angustum TaxID=133377 RepID=A0A2U1JAQ7_SMIAN|nr:hypothetical protein BB558_001824 [Smittium angustum]